MRRPTERPMREVELVRQKDRARSPSSIADRSAPGPTFKLERLTGAPGDPMHDPQMQSLLEPDETHPVLVDRAEAPSPFFLAVDHAGAIIPRRLGTLGLPESELQRHIAWDVGILGVTRRLSEALDATLVAQLYSRLVIDCNRDPVVAT